MGPRGMQTALRLLGIGWYVAISIAGFGYGGYLLDGQLETRPLLTLLGLGLGITVALVGMFRMIMALFPRPQSEPGVAASAPQASNERSR